MITCASSGEWVPLFGEGDLEAKRVWATVRDIAGSVLEKNYEVSSPRLPHSGYEAALLYAYLGRSEADSAWIQHAVEQLNSSVESAAPLKYCALFGGLCGLGWTLNHVSSVLSEPQEPDQTSEDLAPFAASSASDEDEDDLCADIDSLLIRELQRGRFEGSYDLISGLVGFGSYFLDRLPADKARLGVELVLYQLEKQTQEMRHGFAWHTPPERLPEHQRETCPDGYFNLGVAHGVPGILHFLDSAAAAGIEHSKATRLLEGGMGWLVEQMTPAGSHCRFGAWVPYPAPVPNASPSAWCYGDLGVMAVVRQLARRSAVPDWQHLADELLEHCLSVWPANSAKLRDAQFCHGAAGPSHIFNRIYQEDGDTRCLDAARLGFRRVLSMRRDGVGIAGYQAYTGDSDGTAAAWANDPGFLGGAVGIALALLATVTELPPAWDRLLLISRPLREPAA